MMLSPVTFPPGRARLATSPAPTGSALVAMTMGIVLVASLTARVATSPCVQDDINFELDQLGGEKRESRRLALRPSVPQWRWSCGSM